MTETPVVSARPKSPLPDAVFARRESVVRSYCRRFDRVFTSAHGSILVDTAGVEYVDFLAGAGALNYGHNDPDMRAALVRYIESDGITHGLDLHTSAKADFLTTFERLVLTPRDLDYRVQFTGPTGTNAVEASIKLARKITGRTNIIAFTNGFHGVTSGALAATGNGHHRMGPEQGLHGVTRMPFDGYLGPGVDTSELLARMLADPSSGVDAPAAILVEAVQGEGGLNAASPSWLRSIAAIARPHGALLIIDDIQAGCGRSGTFFSFEESGIVPDLVTLSKSISGYGLPLALLLIGPGLDRWTPGEHNGTFRGNQHAFVTATVALEKFWSDGSLMVDVDRRAGIIRSSLAATARRLPDARVKGRGMMQGLDVRDGRLATAVQEKCFAAKLVIETAGPHDEVIKVFAPLTTSDTLLSEGLDRLDTAVSQTLLAGGAVA